MNEPQAEFKYWAFISYSHIDRAVAERLHRTLERYRVPYRLVGRNGRDGPVPRRIAPIFRDREELPTLGDLGHAIRNALRLSRYLIVLCSPRSANSIWVNEEVVAFKRLGRANRILCLILDGEPNASDKPDAAAECFCPALRFDVAPDGQLTTQRVEPLGADIRPDHDGWWNAQLKLIAGIIGVNFDDLKQREKVRQRWRAVRAAAAALVLLAGVAAAWLSIDAYQRQADRGRTAAATSEAAKALREGAYVDVIRLALGRLPRVLPQYDADLPLELIALLDAALERNRFLTLLVGHAQEADSLEFNSTGTRLITTSLDSSVRMWDVAAARTERVLSTAPRARHATFSPDGSRVAVAGDDGGVRIFDAGSGALLHRLEGHARDRIVRRVLFDAAGDLLVSASDDGTTRVWDSRSGAQRFVFGDHLDREGRPDRLIAIRYGEQRRLVLTLAGNSAALWSLDDGRRLATFASDGPAFRAGDINSTGTRLALAANRQIALWDIADLAQPRLVQTMRHNAPINALAFDPVGERLASASEDRSAGLWNGADGRLIEKMPHADSVRAVAFSPAGDLIATASNDFTARVWNGRTGEALLDMVLRGHTQFVFALAFSPDGRRLVTSSGINRIGDPAIRLWDVTRGSALRLDAHEEPVRRAAFAPDGQRIASAGLDGRVHFWDAERLALIADLDFVRHDGAIYSVAFDPAGARVVTASQDRTARIWDLTTRQSLALPTQQDRVTSAAFDPTGERVVIASGRQAQVFDARSTQPIGRPLPHNKDVFVANFSPAGELIVTAEHDERAVLWDARSGLQLRVLGGRPEGHRKSVNWAAFDPTGTLVVTVSDDETARLWNVADGKPIGRPFVHARDEWVLGAVFHPKAPLLVTATNRGRLYFWNLSSGRLEAIRHVHNGETVFSVAFNPAGTRIVTAARDRAVGIYPARIDKQAIIDRAYALSPRVGLRPDEFATAPR